MKLKNILKKSKISPELLESIKKKVKGNLDFYFKEIITQTVFIDRFHENYKSAKFSNIDLYLEIMHLKHILMHFENLNSILFPKIKKSDNELMREFKKEREIQLKEYFHSYEGFSLNLFELNQKNLKNIEKLLKNFTLNYLKQEKMILTMEQSEDDPELRKFLGSLYAGFVKQLYIDKIIDANDILKKFLKGKSY